MLQLIAFGYQKGPAPAADLVVDCRALDNPHRHPQYRQLTGKHIEIQEYVRKSPGFASFWAGLLPLVDNMDDNTTIAFGCSFGKHRSRAVAHMVRGHLMANGRQVAPIPPYVFKDGGTDADA